MVTRCRVCRRPLTDEQSKLLGIGPVCRAKIARSMESVYESDRYDIIFDPATRDIVCKLHPYRDFKDDSPRQRNRFNIWQAHRHHSPTGMNWGYAGSGPADFALNILAVFEDQFPDHGEHPRYSVYQALTGKKRVKLWDGTSVHPLVWDAHQDFKRAFIETMPEKGGTIPGQTIKAWIQAWLTPDDDEPHAAGAFHEKRDYQILPDNTLQLVGKDAA